MSQELCVEVHEWYDMPGEERTRYATLRRGMRRRCHKSLEKLADKPLLQGVATFSARNNWDPLFGIDIGAAYKEWMYLSLNATVVESMLVALDHMQVSVCYLRNARKFGRGIPAFHKNIISFPQDINDMKNLAHFFSTLATNDIINVRVSAPDGSEGETCPRTVRRARVLQLEATGVRVVIENDDVESRTVPLEDIERRVQVPWKPRDLAENLVVFRRRIGRTDEYIEDLRVRRNFIRRILTLLTTRDFYRPDQGEQCRHMYYDTCDISLSSLDELPEDAVPEDLNFQPIDEELPTGHVTSELFVDWLNLGRHDCDVAKALGYLSLIHI